jgi:hypothetical protein
MASYTAQSPAVASPKKFIVSMGGLQVKLGSIPGLISVNKDSQNQNSNYDADRRSTLEGQQTSIGAISLGKIRGYRPPQGSGGLNSMESQGPVNKAIAGCQIPQNQLSQQSGIVGSRGNSLKLIALTGDTPIDSVDEGPGRKNRGNNSRTNSRKNSIAKCNIADNPQGTISYHHLLECSSRTHQTPSMYASGKDICNRSTNLSKYVLQTPPVNRAKKATTETSKTCTDTKEEGLCISKPSHQSSQLSLKSPNKELLSGISERSSGKRQVHPWQREQQAQPAMRTEDIMHAFVADL